MRRLSVALVVAAALLVGGCDLRRSVPLLTWQGSGCFLARVVRPLIFDPDHGTRFMDEGVPKPVVVVWSPGFSARQSGPGVVDVLNAQGSVVATTGKSYSLEGGYIDGNQLGIPGIGSTTVYWVCGDVVRV